MNGSSDQRRNDSHDEDLGLGIVDEVARTSRTSRPAKTRGWLFAVLGLVIAVVLVIVIFSLRSANSTNDTSALGSKDAVSNTLELRSGGHATITTSESADALAVELSELPPLDESEEFVVWAVDEDGNVTRLLQTADTNKTAGMSPAAQITSVHISIESTPVPDSPAGQTEASIDLPLDPAAQQDQGSEAPEEA